MATATIEKSNTKAVPPAEWLAARRELLAKEKEFTRQRDEISRLRRELPWEKVEKRYVFDGAKGKETLDDLFDGRSQLFVYHFMFGPGWEQGCPSCSFIADNFDGVRTHMAQRDVTLVAISRATLPEIEAFKKRMGWNFKWVSSFGSDFNYDYQASFSKEKAKDGKSYYNYQTTEFPSEERPGASVFYKNSDGQIYHTYSTYARGLDILLNAYNFIDMTPKGRDEAGMKPHAMAWVRHHDRYAGGESSGEEKPSKPRMLDPMVAEFHEEVEITRRVLNRIPADKLSWRPHAKSMSLGQLANHIAMVPGRLAKIAQQDSFDVSQGTFEPPQPKSLREIEDTFEESVREAEACLKGMTDEAAQGNWSLRLGDRELFHKPRVGILRSIMLNHWYHHRGQLSVYLRLLEVPVPVIYGRSADENPFA